MNRARMGLKFHQGVWNLQSFIYTRPLKLTCLITFNCGFNVNCARVQHRVPGRKVWNNCRSRGRWHTRDPMQHELITQTQY